MHGRRFASVTLLLAGIVAAVPQCLPGQTIPATWEQDAGRPAQSAEIAILGQVARPGLYRVSTTSPALIDVIRVAGGLTDKASGNIRLIRGGQVVQHVFVSPVRQRGVFGGNLAAVAGDVIVVEKAVTKSGPLRPVGHSAEDSAGVQLALVNLTQSPGVVRVAGEHATVPGVLRLLNQPVELASTVRVIRAGAEQDFEPDGKAGLSSGSVLLFDPSVIEIEKMPPLPPPIMADVPRPLPSAQDAEAELLDEPAEYSPQFPTPVDESRIAGIEARPGASVELLDAPPDEADQPLRVAERQAVPEPVDLPWQSDINSGPYGSAGAPRISEGPHYATDAMADARANEGYETGPGDEWADSAVDAEEFAADSSDSGTLSAAAILVLAGLTFVGISKIVRGMRSASRKPVAAKNSEVATIRSVLDSLIYSELPLVREAVEIPGSMEFSGRLGGGRSLRADAVQAVEPPHFPVAPVPAPQPTAAATPATAARPPKSFRVDSAAKAAGPVRKAAGTPNRTSSGLLDRVLSAVNQERRS